MVWFIFFLVGSLGAPLIRPTKIAEDDHAVHSSDVCAKFGRLESHGVNGGFNDIRLWNVN